jgi:arginyl-tRNA synthetase
MVELPEGRMKSREGTVVDADDLVDEMIKSSESISRELGKLEGMSDDEARNLFETLALGALKYFILKVEPKKTMTFNPKESIDFNGNTGPFIQYTHARISSLCRKASALGLEAGKTVVTTTNLNENEKAVIIQINLFPSVIVEAGKMHSPALIANYIYDLVKEYNQFYHDFPVLKEENEEIRLLRLALSYQVGKVIRLGMLLLGIKVPERM